MSDYRYYQLLPTWIRLLRLLPGGKEPTPLRCELFEYPLQDLNRLYHPYEALSYVWGSEDKPQTIVVDDHNFKITQNLYTALRIFEVMLILELSGSMLSASTNQTSLRNRVKSC